jgi:hypothetical protein
MEGRAAPRHTTRSLGDGLLRRPLPSKRAKATAVVAAMTTIASEHDQSVHQLYGMTMPAPAISSREGLLKEPGETDSTNRTDASHHLTKEQS